MPTTRRGASGSGQAPAPDRTPEEAQAQTGGQQADQRRPRFVPQHIQRRQQAGGQRPQPGQILRQPGQQPLQLPQRAQRGAQHAPRGLGGATGYDGQPGQQATAAARARPQAAGGRAGAFYTGDVLGQWSVNYPNDVWFFDGSLWQWMQLDQTSESAVMLMNEVVSLARAHTLPLYYDTDDSTGMVVDVYTF
jgi:hypothetical protein